MRNLRNLCNLCLGYSVHSVCFYSIFCMRRQNLTVQFFSLHPLLVFCKPCTSHLILQHKLSHFASNSSSNKNTNAQSCPAALCEFHFSLLRLQVLFTSHNSCAGLRCRPLQLLARCLFFSANLTLSDAFFLLLSALPRQRWSLEELSSSSSWPSRTTARLSSSPWSKWPRRLLSVPLRKKKFSSSGRGCRAVFRRKKNKATKQNCGPSFCVLPVTSSRRCPAYSFSSWHQVASPLRQLRQLLSAQPRYSSWRPQ